MTDPTTHHHHHDHDGVATTESGHVDDSHAEHEGHAVKHGAHAGHGDHGSGHSGHAGHGDHVSQFRRLFWINLVIAIPVVAFSPMFAMLLGYSVPSWAGWVAAVLGTVMYAWGGTPFLTGAVSELKSRKPGMMLLIALGITVAFLASWAATVGLVHHELEFWWELALLIVIMLLGHWIEMRSLAQTTSALDSLAALLPDEAERVEGDETVKVDPAELRVGDVVIVRPGGSVPADGTVIDGRADMDESMITGESRPVARGGVLVKDRLALESMRQVDAVLFDKTGTLTKGEPTVTGVEPIAGLDADQVLALAAAAEADSEHPLAQAIVAAAKDKNLTVEPASGFSSSPAVGVTATVAGQEVRVGGPRLLEETGQHEIDAADGWRAEGAIILHVLRDNTVIGGLKLADEVRPESRDAVDALHELGVEVVMITGDAEAVANEVGRELGIDRVFAGVRPEDKSAKVDQLQKEGKKVAMVGDGVNDAPALAQSDIGIAIGAGTDVAIASAGVILASSDPRSVLSVIQLSRAAYRKMKQNLWWAAGYNLLSVPLAAGVLAPVGFVMPMSVGAILMSISTVVVALNAQLLRRIDLTPGESTRSVLERQK